MNLAQSAIMPELPPVSVLPHLPLRLPGDHAGNIDCLTAELNIHRARLELLRDLSRSASRRPIDDVLDEMTIGVRKIMRSDLALVALLNDQTEPAAVAAFDSALVVPNQEAIATFAQQLGKRVVSSEPWTGALDEAVLSHTVWPLASLNWISVLPLTNRNELVGILALGKRDESCYTAEEVDFLLQVASQVALAVGNAIICDELGRGKNDSYQESESSQEEDGREPVFEGIVGSSAALQRVLRQVEVVAPTDSGVLILGETGTGKELIARAIHNLSARRDRPFIKLNCAAIPSGLLESELFGHERGAFTGAIMRKAGRFEAADKGTLFLDEVGDIPLELQPKLLRVLQEHEFERLGSTRTQQVDVRVVAATHRDLKQMVEDGRFRSDLYYRLHVFPLPVPPLRERREDIPLLVRHFVDEYAGRMNRRIETIPPQAIETLRSYSWPGNVRELQNFIERTVILSPGSVLRPPLAELKQAAVQTPGSELSTLGEMEREHVLRALRASNWVVGGPNGAAARLGMKRTTLAYRIRKLNIPLRPQ
ncbi:MAG TPA: sigma 54-interacting transcriptional regulator [Terriglobales bacterium]|nr:sigma 54-interacting transcriptional regulator [Terriglobales bacterium]